MKRGTFSLLVCILGLCVYTVAQDGPAVNITGTGTTGTVPKFTAPHTIGNSIITLSNDVAHVAGGVAATKGGSTAENVVSGKNTSTVGLVGGAGVFGELSTTGESGVGSSW